MKKLVLLQLALLVVLGACGKDNKSSQNAPGGSGGVTWSESEKQNYLSTCPFGEKQCSCLVTVFQQKSITYSQLENDPSLTGSVVSSPEFADCAK